MNRAWAVVVLIAVVGVGSAADWTRFRGPNGTGAVVGLAPVQFDAKANVTWKVDLPGGGVGSPIVVKGKVYVQCGEGGVRQLACVDIATGKLLWTKDVASPPAPGMHKKNSASSGTPASDGERVYCSFWLGNDIAIHAYDLTGRPLWDTAIGKYVAQHGAAHSPMVHDGRVFFHLDQDGAAELVALDAKTGKIVWRKDRKANRSCYTTPFVIEEKGRPAQLVVGSTTSIESYDPKTGDVNWNYTVQWPKGAKELRAVGQQVYAAGNVVTYFGEGGTDRYMVAVKADGRGDITSTGKAWDVRLGKSPYVPSILVHQEHLYWVTDTGLAVCADAKTGKFLWNEKVFEKAVSASPILIDGVVLAMDEAGTVVSFKANSKELGDVEKSQLRENVLASPAAADGRLFIRAGRSLYCFGGKGS